MTIFSFEKARGGNTNTCKTKSTAANASTSAALSPDIGSAVMIDGEKPFGFFSSAAVVKQVCTVDLVNEGGREAIDGGACGRGAQDVENAGRMNEW